MKFLLYLLSTFLLISCKNNNKQKSLDFTVFKISVDNDWHKINLEGIDSYVGAIKTAKGDTLIFEYGIQAPMINDAYMVEDIKNYNKMKSEGFNVENIFFSKNFSLDQNQAVFHKEYYLYDTIDSYLVKMKIPKNIGNGLTAISFDSLDVNKNKFYLFGKNLDTLEQFKLLKAFKTIKITRK